MSSTYRVLCLSHDPALVVDDMGVGFSRPEAAEEAIRDGIDGHADCDLLIGRYSYPLIEVGCPPTNGSERPGRHRCTIHGITEWVDVAWLRLAAAVYQSGNEQMRALADDRSLCCWSWERLRRLRDELGIDLEGQG